ncbi:MAG: hypothetical protein RLZZ386_1037 [Planctomycetota bacterium]
MIPLKYVRLFVDDAGLSHFEEFMHAKSSAE